MARRDRTWSICTSWLRSGSYVALLIALLAASRFALAPKYLYSFDNINFALALEDFNPAKHQPQPPGYPLFVGLQKLIHFAIPSVKYTQLVSGLVGSTAAVVAIWYLGNLLFGGTVGWLAAALLLFNPAFWLAGIGNHVRTFLAAGSIATAVCVWKAWNSSRWVVPASLVLGIAAGFRPDLLLLLFPLWLSTLIRHPFPKLAPVALTAAVIPWVAVTIWKSGGAAGARVFTSYFQFHLSRSSALMGAGIATGATMGLVAVYWTFLGALTWAWALPWEWRKIQPNAAWRFLALWFLPSFLFHVLAQWGEPDLMLDIIPALCLAGGAVLGLLGRQTVLLAGVVAALNALLFFVPPYRLGREASYRFVKSTGDSLTSAVESIRNSDYDLIVDYRRKATGHQLGYYYPAIPILNLDHDCSRAYLTWHKRTWAPRIDGNTIYLPRAQKIGWFNGEGPLGPMATAETSPGGCRLAYTNRSAAEFMQ